MATIPFFQRPAFVFALFAGLMGFAVAGFAPQIFNDGDSWWHLAAGNWMLDHHMVLTRDVFSFTVAGKPWDAQEWLSEVLMALAFRAAGWTGLHLLFGASFGLAAAIVTYYVRARTTALPALLIALIGLACVTGGLLARPHILALPALALWTFELLKAREQKRAPHMWLLAVMLLWANLHGSFAFGLALTAAFALEALIEAHGIVKGGGHALTVVVGVATGSPEFLIYERKVWKGWGLFLILSVAAAALTPQLLNGLLFPFQLLIMGSIRNIGEWAPTALMVLAPFPIALVCLIYVLATGRLKLPIMRAILLFGLIYLALAHMRHQLLFGIVAPMLVAPALRITADEKPSPTFLAPSAIALLTVLIIARCLIPTTRSDDRVSPMTALNSVPASLRSQPVLNQYDLGGYLIFQGVKVFVDGRTDLYGDKFLGDYDLMLKPDAKALSDGLEKWHIAWTIMPPGPAAKMMDTLPGWRRSYSDAYAVVHIKE